MNNQYLFFWGKEDKDTEYLSNWHLTNFTDENNINYNCTEQYMMYHKALLFNDYEIADKILLEKNPREHKKYGRLVKNFDINIWNQHAKVIVYNGCKLKFEQNIELLNKLKEIKKEIILVEASPYDTVWGIGLGKDDPRINNKTLWLGTNWLGEVLTKLKNDLI